MRNDVNALKERLEMLTEYERKALETRDKEKELKPCGFEYGTPECNFCMRQKYCADEAKESDRSAWQKLTRVMVAYKTLEKDLREMNSDDLVARETLARVLRCIANNGTVVGIEDENNIREAEKIFSELYYSTGNQQFREEAESCRLMHEKHR